MRRWLIPTITLVLCLGTLFGIVPRRLIAKGASIELPLPSKFLAAVSADKQVASPRGKSLADEAQLLLTDITFRGTAIEFVTLFDMPGQWRVSVSEVLSGPPISGEVSVFVDTFEPPCLGHEDTSIEPGDTVEVRGMFHDGPVITICESNSYYIVKLVGEEIKFRGTTVSLDDLGLYWSVQVDEVISGPDLTGQTVDVHVVNYDPVPCAGTVDPNIVEGDRVEVYGRYEDYNRVYVCDLENYYIRRECSTHHFRGEVIQRSDDLGPTEYGFVIRVTGILTETPDFDINMGDEVYVWAEEGAIGTPLPGIGDIVEVKGHSGMVSCVPFNPACDAVGIWAEAACNEYIQHVKREIRGRVFRFGVNTGGPLESLPLPMGVPVRLHKIQRNVHPCGFGMTHRGAIDVEVMHDGEFSFTFDDERDVQYCDSPDGNNRACEPKDVFIPGELEVDPNNAWGYRAETTVYYSSEDFNSGKSVYLEVYVYPGRSWWDDDTRHEALTLFPPDGLDAAGKYNGVYDGIPDIHHTNSQLAPLILVHGHGGEAEYWRGIREPLAKPRGYMNLDGMGQMWEVYYPGEEHIEQGAAVLKDGIDTILDQYNNSYTKVDIVAHSMGGPISRAYIAGIAKPENGDWESYDPKVRRLLMLATPNFGVVFAARIRDGDRDCTDLANTFLFHHDPNEPAMRDLAMGSRFFAGLGSKGLSNLNKVLVAAGIRRTLPQLGCFESQGQDDTFIGLSSASLLSYGYPLAVLYRNHSQMRGTGGYACSRALPQPESDTDDNPHNDVRELLDLINAFLNDLPLVFYPSGYDLYVTYSPATGDYRVWEWNAGDTGYQGRKENDASKWEFAHIDAAGTPVPHEEARFDRGGLLLQIVDETGRPEDDAGNSISRSVLLSSCMTCTDGQALEQNTESKLWYIDSTYGGVLPSGEYVARILSSNGSYLVDGVTIKPSQTASKTIPLSEGTWFSMSYDLDSSGTVDAGDIQVASSEWRCKCGDPCYNSLHDFDLDCDTDIADIMSVVARWEGDSTRSWTQKHPINHPSARMATSMAYSTDNSAIILFGGGLSGQYSNETWSYDGDNWTLLSPVTSPPSRAAHAMAYDSDRNRIVMFGGWNGNNVQSDTWEYNGTTWTKVTTATSPPARHHHAMVYDSAQKRIVLFGGDLETSFFFDDTWVYDGNWTQINPTNHPSRRRGHAMAYDSDRNKIVLFGGVDKNQQCLGDTWEYDGNNWVQTSTTGPAPRNYASMVYDSVKQKLVLFGGGCSGAFDDTWEYADGVWIQMNTGTAPSPRGQFGLAYDVLRQVTVLFGGGGGSLLDDTWEYGRQKWSSQNSGETGRISPLG